MYPGFEPGGRPRPVALAKGDQVAGLSRGIASLRLYDDRHRQSVAPPVWRNRARRIERLILSLDTGTEAPPDPGTALLLRSGRYLTNAGHHPAGRAHAPAHARGFLHLALLVAHQLAGGPPAPAQPRCRSRYRSASSSCSRTCSPAPGSSRCTASRSRRPTDPARNRG